MPDLAALDYEFARFVIERGLAALYLIAFLVAANQFPALSGDRGLEPARFLLAATSFRRTPSIFHLGYSDRRLRVVGRDRHDRRRHAPAGTRATGAAAGHDARVVRALGPLQLDREHRRDVVLVRLGDVAARGRLPGDLPRQCRDAAAVPGDPPVPLARLPRRVRCRAHQAPRRSVLAQPDLHGLAPRDPADAEPVVVVLPSPAAAGPPDRGRRELRGPADPAVRLVPPAARRIDRGRPDDRHPALPGRERQLRLAQLGHDRDPRGGDRRPDDFGDLRLRSRRRARARRRAGLVRGRGSSD